MKTYQGVGNRIRERLIALGYVRKDGEADVATFCFDWRFGPTSIYGWIAEVMTPTKDLVRLCQALDCSIEWLLSGQERVVPKAQPRQGRGRVRSVVLALAASGALALSPSSSVAGDLVHLIGSKRRFRNKIRYIGAGNAYAV